MVQSSSPAAKLVLIGFVTLSFTLFANEQGLAPSTAMAHNFIEKLLNGNQPKQKRKRTRSTKKRTSQSQPKKAAPATEETKAPVQQRDGATPPIPAIVPVPTPSPKSDLQDKQIPTTPSAPNTDEKPPVPAAKPAQDGNKPEPTPSPTDEQKEQKPDADKQENPDQPGRVYQVSCPAIMSGDVQGKLLPPVNEGDQCRIQSPIALTAIGKETPLKFAGTITTNCAMAVTLAQWSDEVTKITADVYGSGVKIDEIGTGSDFQCRKVNGAATGRISEHSFANALDIMSFKFSNGTKTELESGWNGSDNEKKFWRAVHSASCRLFMTVIGPDGDAAHRTNMHIDQGCHGKSCEARICQ